MGGSRVGAHRGKPLYPKYMLYPNPLYPKGNAGLYQNTTPFPITKYVPRTPLPPCLIGWVKWENIDVIRPVLSCSELLGNARECSGMLGNARECSGMLGAM